MAFDGDDALLKHLIDRPGVGDAIQLQLRHGLIFAEDGDGADVEDAVEDRLVEMEVRTVGMLDQAAQKAMTTVTASDCEGFFRYRAMPLRLNRSWTVDER